MDVSVAIEVHAYFNRLFADTICLYGVVHVLPEGIEAVTLAYAITLSYAFFRPHR